MKCDNSGTKDVEFFKVWKADASLVGGGVERPQSFLSKSRRKDNESDEKTHAYRRAEQAVFSSGIAIPKG
ncbi:MAG: hypothetical protein EBU80_12885 [Chitinophagia bacterium]|nr:hypothetical protein [Chitinophagia bacterium]